MSPYNAQEAIVKYGTKTNRIDLIQASYWQANNGRTGLNAVRAEDRNIQNKIMDRVIPTSVQDDLRKKIYYGLKL